jgi:filamentous hemagglutinin family protein
MIIKYSELVIQITLVFFEFFIANSTVLADIKPDNTLGRENSQVIQTNVNGIPSEIVNGGALRGDVLFHSLSTFNIQNNNGGYFSSPTGVTNIFARVTGGKSSNIDGVLGVLGNANLFLINANGVIFGKNSSLDLNGSFTTTTANSIIFPEFEFSSVNSNSVPLLNINIPIGLRFSNNTGNIQIQNTGFSIYQPANSLEPATPLSQPPPGLQIKPGQSLSLIGSNRSCLKWSCQIFGYRNTTNL